MVNRETTTESRPLRRLLLFAYFFPPTGGAGVQRVVKFAKYLPEWGWIPTVVTVASSDYWMKDPTLGSEVPPGTQVVRTKALTGLSLLRRLAPAHAGTGAPVRKSARAIRSLRRIASFFLVPDTYVGWVPFAVAAGKQLLTSRGYDAMMTTSSPDSAHLIGLQLAKRFGVPWIADFRDPWTRRMAFSPPTVLHASLHRHLEGRVLKGATLVTVTSEETRRDYLNLYPEMPPEKIRVVTNGYDEEDFQSQHAQPPRDRFVLLHAGQLNPERPARPLLEGVSRFLEMHPEARGVLSVQFLGPHYESDSRASAELGVSGCVRFEQARPHRETIERLLGAHVLVLMEQDSERGGLILPGKIFEYLRARRPILGLLPKGAAWRLIEELGVGVCVRTGDAAACARQIERFYRQFQEGGPPGTGLSSEVLRRFERRSLAGRLAGLLEVACGRVSSRRPRR